MPTEYKIVTVARRIFVVAHDRSPVINTHKVNLDGSGNSYVAKGSMFEDEPVHDVRFTVSPETVGHTVAADDQTAVVDCVVRRASVLGRGRRLEGHVEGRELVHLGRPGRN